MSSSVVIGLVVGIIILYLGLLGLVIANYVLSSLGMYRFAKNRQISDPWMAWIPVVNDYLLGKVTEKYDESKGMKHRWSKVMLILALVNIAGMVLFFVVYFVMLFTTITRVALSEGYVPEEELAGMMVVLFIVIFVVALVMSFATIAYSVCKYVCIYKVFESSVPEKSIKYFILSMIIPLAYGICLMKSAKVEMEIPELEEIN